MPRTVSALYTALAVAGAIFATPALAQAPNLAVSFKAPTSPPLTWGSGGTYTINIKNNGTATAPAPALTATLPAALTLGKVTGCTMSKDTSTPPKAVFPCVLADIVAGDTAVVTIAVGLDAPSDLTVCPDPTIGDVVVTVADNTTLPIANLAIEVTGPTSAGPGADLAFNVMVTNNGPCDALAVVASNVVAYGEATAVSAGGGTVPADACTVTEDQSEVDCDLGDMANLAQATYTANFKVGSTFASDLLKATDYFDFAAAGDSTDLGSDSATENAVTINVRSNSGCSSAGAGGGLLAGLLAIGLLARRRRVTA
jgi:uncharacterized repeat protein (TIGR01451 family)/MYXO-CTERM domain-containing protein